MTYISKRRARARRRPQQAMGGLFDIITSGGVDLITELTSKCPDDADNAVVELDNVIADIERSWRPTGFYTPAEIDKVVTTVLDQVAKVRARMEELGDEMKILGKVESQFDALNRQTADTIDFINAAKKARAAGLRVVNAPGLQSWVLDTLKANRNLGRAMILASCQRSFFEKALADTAKDMMIVRSVVLTVGSAALAAGEVAVEVLGGLGQFLAVTVKFLPFIALGAGGLYLYKKMKDRRSSP